MTFRVMRVSIIGSAPGGESWSVNPCYSFGDFDSPDPTFTQMAAAAAAVNAVVVPTELRNNLSTALSVTGCRLEAREASGGLRVVGEALRGAPLAGLTTAIAPYQTSQVFSLRSEAPGGRGRGRLYWPAISSGMSSTTLRLSSAHNTGIIAAMKTYLSGVGDALEAPLGLTGAGLVVWSRASADTFPVISLQTGDVLDTQRRRRDRATETYTTVAFP